MLTIKNISNTGLKEFQWAGNEWVLYGIDTTNIEYRFIFLPMEAGRYDTNKSHLVILNRTKHNRRGYRLWTTDGKHTYVNTNDIRNWSELVKRVYENRMVSNNN